MHPKGYRVIAWLVLKRYAPDENQAIISNKIYSNSNFNFDILNSFVLDSQYLSIARPGYLEGF